MRRSRRRVSPQRDATLYPRGAHLFDTLAVGNFNGLAVQRLLHSSVRWKIQTFITHTIIHVTRSCAVSFSRACRALVTSLSLSTPRIDVYASR